VNLPENYECFSEDEWCQWAEDFTKKTADALRNCPLSGSIVFTMPDLLKNNTRERFIELLDCKLAMLRQDLIAKWDEGY